MLSSSENPGMIDLVLCLSPSDAEFKNKRPENPDIRFSKAQLSVFGFPYSAMFVARPPFFTKISEMQAWAQNTNLLPNGKRNSTGNWNLVSRRNFVLFFVLKFWE